MFQAPMLNRIFVWSILFELLGYFSVPFFGQTPAISRFLQGVVFLMLIIKWLSCSRVQSLRMINISHPKYRYYSLYFAQVMVVGSIGMLSGVYSIEFINDLSKTTALHSGRTSIGPIQNAVFQYIIVLYYFVYFVILPQYFLKSRESLNYFFSRFTFTFVLCLAVGFIDFAYTSFDNIGITKNLATATTVGNRFHGLAGEPRHAFVYLFLGMAILYLKSYFMNKSFSKWWLLPIIVGAILTKSASGLLGILFFTVMYGVYIFSKCNVSKSFKFTVLLLFVVGFVYVALGSSERIMRYIDVLPYSWEALEAGKELPSPLSVQGYNVYPIHDLTVKLRELNLLPILFGSGLGSGSVINNSYLRDFYIVSNPQSQLVRTIYEAGIIGTFLFALAFFYPVKYLTKLLPPIKREQFILLSLLLLGLFLAQRHAAIYIYLGMFLAVFNVPNMNASGRILLRGQ